MLWKRAGVRAAEFVDDGRLAIVGKDGTISIAMESEKWKELLLFEDIRSADLRWAQCMAVCQTKPLLAVGTLDGQVGIWDVNTGNIVGIAREHRHPVKALAFGHNGDRLASGDDAGIVRVLQLD